MLDRHRLNIPSNADLAELLARQSKCEAVFSRTHIDAPRIFGAGGRA